MENAAVICKHSHNSKRAFTLIEMMIVIGIISILAVVATPNMISVLYKANLAADEINISVLNHSTVLYAAEQSKSTTDVFPQGSSDASKMDILLNNNYINSIPVPRQKNFSFIFNEELGIWHMSGTKLYDSNFSTMDYLKDLKGKWSVTQNILSPVNYDEARVIFSGTSGTDYTINMKSSMVKTKSGGTGYGIYYRATENYITGAISGYCFQYDPGFAGGSFIVREVVNGGEIDPAQNARVSMASVMPKGFDVNATHDVQIKVIGDSHVITVDGIKVLDFNDNTFTQGIVGARSWSNSQLKIYDVSVTK